MPQLPCPETDRLHSFLALNPQLNPPKKTVLRARNYGKKRDRMQALKLKAAMKNPDEFYFAMHRKKTEGGVHLLDGAESLPHDVVQVRT